MQNVYLVGIGQTPIGEWWTRSLNDLADEALKAACTDAGIDQPDSLIVTNMLAGQLSGQKNLERMAQMKKDIDDINKKQADRLKEIE